MSRIIAQPSLKIKATRKTSLPSAPFGAGILASEHSVEFGAPLDRSPAERMMHMREGNVANVLREFEAAPESHSLPDCPAE